MTTPTTKVQHTAATDSRSWVAVLRNIVQGMVSLQFLESTRDQLINTLATSLKAANDSMVALLQADQAATSAQIDSNNSYTPVRQQQYNNDQLASQAKITPIQANIDQANTVQSGIENSLKNLISVGETLGSIGQNSANSVA